MFEAAAIWAWVEKVLVVLLAVVAYLVKNLLSEIRTKIDAILVQVHATNGRVGVLEEWKRNHEKSVDGIHQGFRDWMSNMSKQLQELLRQGR